MTGVEGRLDNKSTGIVTALITNSESMDGEIGDCVHCTLYHGIAAVWAICPRNETFGGELVSTPAFLLSSFLYPSPPFLPSPPIPRAVSPNNLPPFHIPKNTKQAVLVSRDVSGEIRVHICKVAKYVPGIKQSEELRQEQSGEQGEWKRATVFDPPNRSRAPAAMHQRSMHPNSL